MPRYYCDYCDTYLTHDSPSVRKQHNAGYKHKANVRIYYEQFEAQQSQYLVDQKVKEHLGQSAPFQQVGAAYNQLRLRFPVLPTPMLPMAGNPQFPGNLPFVSGMRPPILPGPIPGTSGYVSAPSISPLMAPPNAPSLPGQFNGLPRHATENALTTVSGNTATPTSSGAPPMFAPSMYQANLAAPTTGGFDSSNMNAQAPVANL